MEDLPNVLIVEDDELIQSVVEDALSEGGFEPVMASSGENAVELLDASHSKYRALVTDINLGRGKGSRSPCQRNRSGISRCLNERR